MLRYAVVLVSAILAVTVSQQPTAPAGAPSEALLTRARALHKQSPLIDGHNDYPWALREHARRGTCRSSTSRSRSRQS